MKTNTPFLKSILLLLVIILFSINAFAQMLHPRDNEHCGPENSPAADLLYKPKKVLNGQHPRLFFSDISINEMKKRTALPAYEKVWSKIKEKTLDFSAQVPPDSIDIMSEDYRKQCDYLAWLALAYTLDDDATRRNTYMQGIETWVNAWYKFKRSKQDLVNSQLIMGLSYIYDWLYKDLDKPLKDKVRFLIVDEVRWLRSPNHIGASMWRNKHFGANHNWYNNTAMGLAAIALWGETGQTNGNDPDEPRLWLNSVMKYYWEFQKRLSTDGAPVEGFLYSDYGMRPYLDFAVVAEQVTTLSKELQLIDCPALQNFGKTRLRLMLPNQNGFVCWSDCQWKHYGDSWQFRFCASRFKDSESQTVASVMEKVSNSYDWRVMFYYDVSVPETSIQNLPLYADFTNMDIYSARNSWSGDQNFFSFKCGLAGGKSGTVVDPDDCTGHCQTDNNTVTFWWNDFPILERPGYERKKRALHHSIAKIEYMGSELEQCGGGNQWFMLFPGNCFYGYKDRMGNTKTLEVKHTDLYHTYLGESGGLYVINYNPCGYRRRVVYFPSGTVVIADRITTPEPVNVTFRLLTLCDKLSQEKKIFKFSAGETPGNITDYSPSIDERWVSSETVYAWDHSKTDGLTLDRKVVNLLKNNTKKVFFGTVINMSNNKISISRIDDQGIVVEGNNGEKYNFNWDVE